MNNYDSMPQDVKEYAERRIQESGVRCVPGHYPVFGSKEQVDRWLRVKEESLREYFGEETDE